VPRSREVTGTSIVGIDPGYRLVGVRGPKTHR